MAEGLPVTYGDRFEKLLPKVVADIEKEIALLTSNILNNSVADNQKLTYLLDNEAELKRYINERYSQAYNESTKAMYADALDLNKSIFADNGVDFAFRQDQLDVMSQLKRRNVLLYNIETSKAANIIFDSLVSWAYTGNSATLRPFEALVGEMGASRYGSTIINTQINTFSRSVTAMAAEQANVKKFKYMGPKPDRAFCIPLVGKTFTIDEINQMDNGQLPDVLRTCGGYSCRHFWVPIQDDV